MVEALRKGRQVVQPPHQRPEPLVVEQRLNLEKTLKNRAERLWIARFAQDLLRNRQRPRQLLLARLSAQDDSHGSGVSFPDLA